VPGGGDRLREAADRSADVGARGEGSAGGQGAGGERKPGVQVEPRLVRTGLRPVLGMDFPQILRARHQALRPGEALWLGGRALDPW
jgi:hypothetical protein